MRSRLAWLGGSDQRRGLPSGVGSSRLGYLSSEDSNGAALALARGPQIDSTLFDWGGQVVSAKDPGYGAGERGTLEIASAVVLGGFGLGFQLGRWPAWSAVLAVVGYLAWVVVYSEVKVQTIRLRSARSASLDGACVIRPTGAAASSGTALHRGRSQAPTQQPSSQERPGRLRLNLGHWAVRMHLHRPQAPAAVVTPRQTEWVQPVTELHQPQARSLSRHSTRSCCPQAEPDLWQRWSRQPRSTFRRRHHGSSTSGGRFQHHTNVCRSGLNRLNRPRSPRRCRTGRGLRKQTR